MELYSAELMTIAAAIALIVILIVARDKFEQRRYWNSPERRIQAAVVKKRGSYSPYIRFGRRSLSGWRKSMERHRGDPANYRCIVVFRAEGGKRLKFRVAGHDFTQLKVGMQGELVYRGSRFLAFTGGGLSE